MKLSLTQVLIWLDDVPKYTPPKGGGGITNTIIKNGKTITFGHGGRRDVGVQGFNYGEVEDLIANHVSQKSLNIGHNAPVYIPYEGKIIEYRPYLREDNGIINIGTYIIRGK